MAAKCPWRNTPPAHTDKTSANQLARIVKQRHETTRRLLVSKRNFQQIFSCRKQRLLIATPQDRHIDHIHQAGRNSCPIATSTFGEIVSPSPRLAQHQVIPSILERQVASRLAPHHFAHFAGTCLPPASLHGRTSPRCRFCRFWR